MLLRRGFLRVTGSIGNGVGLYSSLKQELTHHERFVDHDQARSKVFQYIEVFYNRQRLHSALDYQSPDEFEKMVAVA